MKPSLQNLKIKSKAALALEIPLSSAYQENLNLTPTKPSNDTWPLSWHGYRHRGITFNEENYE